ncbi:MAG: hypothetical protein ACI902_000127 [Psychroserpens sp.]|jgi:hypothetical protein
MNMTYFKYFLIVLMSISVFSCSSTNTVISEDNIAIETRTEIEVQTETKVETEPEESEISEAIIKASEIKDNVQTDYVTIQADSTLYITQGNFVIDHSQWNELLQKHVSDQGHVNYKGFKTDITKFNHYLKSVSETPPQESWSKERTLAYWMNVYNAYTIKLILNNYPTQSIKDIDGPWNERFIKIGEKWYTLNDVEHRIIRKMDEPRIHFTLVCAAVSCPKLYNKAFTAKNLEADLELLTKGFLSDTTKNELSESSIKISKIFKWYGGDFKKDGEDLIDFLNRYSDFEISSKAKKSYTDYNWNLNE